MIYTHPDWHTLHAPVWQELLPPLLPDRPIRWLEIGSFEGRSAVWTLDHLLRPGDELVCVDTWTSQEIEANFDANTFGRATKKKCRSESYLIRERDPFFGVYIDGSHDAPDVILDAVLSWRLLEVGGVMIFDDARWHHPPHVAGKVSPGVAVSSFAACYATRTTVLHSGSQIILQKRA